MVQSISAPCYGADVRMDVTKLVTKCKETGRSFFIEMLYLVTETLNGIDEFRMRICKGEPYIFDIVNPSYTIMTASGWYVNRRTLFADHDKFYDNAAKTIEKAKHDTVMEADGNKSEILDDFYFSCTPWMDFRSITQPIPYNDPGNASIPRIAWGKFVPENGGFALTLNMTVHHALVDGKPLSEAFNRIQERLNQV